MGRRLRYIPEGGTLVEVTCRTIHSRFLLRPSPELNDIVVGVLRRAQRLYEVRCCAFSFLSSHFHFCLTSTRSSSLARFMGYVNSNLAREVGRLCGWEDKIWSRRYQAIIVGEEEGAQIARLKYVLANGCKEDLVARPQDWPGVHAARALVMGEALTGTWFDRTQEYAVRRSRTGSQPLGVAAIRGQHPHDCPKRPKKSPRCSTPGAPRCATSSGKRTPGSSRPSGTRRRSCERETDTRRFRSAASLRPCRSWEGSSLRVRGPQALE
jgi:REP element-mobilizing transposase RayT